jgi:hypothetical protein
LPFEHRKILLRSKDGMRLDPVRPVSHGEILPPFFQLWMTHFRPLSPLVM